MSSLTKSAFTDPDAIAKYAEGPRRNVPGYSGLLPMTGILLAQRLSMVSEIRRRLKPGAPFVAAHLSVADGEGERDVWMSRYAAFLTASGADPGQAAATRKKVEKELTILAPAQDETLLRDAGFNQVRLFYVGFTFRGWVAYA